VGILLPSSGATACSSPQAVQKGEVFILRASPRFEVLATNSVNEPTNASLAASDGDLFLRTDDRLWCFANAK